MDSSKPLLCRVDGVIGDQVSLLSRGDLGRLYVMDWCAPVPFFGNLLSSDVATVGLNPSSSEFVGHGGQPIRGMERRLPSLLSLRIGHWEGCTDTHIRSIRQECLEYFTRNPYDRWFRRLDRIVAGANASFYPGGARPACHLDLVPFATKRKWGALPSAVRSELLSLGANSLGRLINSSRIRVLLLNGSSVATAMGQLEGLTLARERVPDWDLPRASGRPVPGYRYEGIATSLAGVTLDRPITVVGYNHNIQSSFGISNDLVAKLTDWFGAKGGPH